MSVGAGAVTGAIASAGAEGGGGASSTVDGGAEVGAILGVNIALPTTKAPASNTKNSINFPQGVFFAFGMFRFSSLCEVF
jgi:L-aminopeptidase/D-esterase-like protein